MNEIKIRSDSKIRQAKGIRAFDLIRELQLQGLNINKQRYYKLEHDLANVFASELVAIAEYLGVDISELFKQ